MKGRLLAPGFQAVLLAALVAAASAAEAGTLADDPNAMPGWAGARAFSNSGTYPIAAVVEYAVYAPAQFAGTFPGADPSGGTGYVYAYQIFNDPSEDVDWLTLLSVGLAAEGIVSNIGTVDDIVGLPGIPPTGVSSEALSAKWSYLPDGLEHNQKSQILFFTSPLAPGWNDATLDGFWLPSSGTLPSPVPEPGAWTMLAALAVLGATARCRRRPASHR
jgi:MYXO-CTERM domain-containing protein